MTKSASAVYISEAAIARPYSFLNSIKIDSGWLMNNTIESKSDDWNIEDYPRASHTLLKPLDFTLYCPNDQNPVGLESIFEHPWQLRVNPTCKKQARFMSFTLNDTIYALKLCNV